MLNNIGRGLSPATKRPPFSFRFLNFASSLPAEVTFTRNSKATCRNAEGKLIEVDMNEPRLDYTKDGTPLGLYIEHEATNKCQNYNVNPTDTSQTLDNGLGILSIVDDSAELAAAGLDEICTNGNVYKAEATSGSTFIVYFLGNTNNTNKHSMSLYARGEGASGTCGRLALGGAELPIAEAGDNYQRFKYEDLTPDGTGRKFTIAINGNSTLYFILNQLEESSECTSVIPVAGSAVTRPTDRARILNADQKDWFDVNQGYMICRYTMERLLSSDVYLAIFNNSSSSNTIGYRIEGSSKTLKGYVRSASSSQHANTNDDTQPAGVLNTAGIRWNNTDIDILSGGSVENRSMLSLPIGINELEIGARNGGAGSLYGHILSLEIGTQDVTLAQLGNKMHKSNDRCIIGGGQSLIRGYFISQENNNENGKQTLRQIIGEAEQDKSFVFIDGSTGGSAACKTTDAVNYWWDNTTNMRGPAFDSFYNQLNPIGAKPTAILWAQGEQDGHVMGVYTSATEYKDALTAIFTDMRSTLGPLHIYIQKIGRRVGSYSNFGGIQTVRDIQNKMIAQNDFISDAAEVYDLPLFDDVHLTNTGYDTAAERNSLALLNQEGAIGPQIINAVRVGSEITITLSHDAGTDFTPTSGIEGFKFYDGGSEITITSAIRTDETTITLTLNNVPLGTEMLYYGYDDMAGVNISNLVTDNAVIPMPLRLSKIEL